MSGAGDGQRKVPGAAAGRGGGRAEGSDDVRRLLEAYPRIYFACHQRHVRDPEGGGELSANQASILSHLDSVDPTRVTDLADHMGVTPSTMSLSVKRLERDGYVGRSPDPDDGRVVQLRLTDKGERMRGAQEVLDRRRVARLLGGLEAEAREAALRGMEVLARAADAMVRGAGAWAGGDDTDEEVA